jgi:Transposase DDE domain group 1
LWGVVSPRRICRDQLGARQPGAVRFYNKRGTAEQWIKEAKQAVAMTRLSCHRFRANQVRLWLSVIAYNLGKLVGAAGAGDADREVVADQLAAAVGEDRRTAHQTCALLLVGAGGEASDAAVVCRHAAEDRGAAIAGGTRRAQRGADFNDDAGRREKRVQDDSNKRHFGAWPSHQMRKSAPLVTRGPKSAKTLPRAAVWSTAELESESKKEIPVEYREPV